MKLEINMNENVYSRLLRALGVIFLIVVIIALWQVWVILGLAFLIYVYVKDRGRKFPKTYYCIMLPFKLLGNTK